MILSESLLSILLVVALVSIVLLAVLCGVLYRRLGQLRRSYASALDPSRREDLFQSMERQAAQLEAVRNDLGIVHDNTEHLRDLLRTSVSKVGLVRYDAFDDMGGALSFSAALLDERGDGVVLSAINGRSETRAYAKAVKGADSENNLSAEEHAAIDVALAGGGGETFVRANPRPHRRRRAAS